MRSFFRKLFRKKNNKTQKIKRSVFETVKPFLNKRAPMAAPPTRKSPPYNRLQKNKSVSNRKSSDFSLSRSGKISRSYNKLHRPDEGTDTKVDRRAGYEKLYKKSGEKSSRSLKGGGKCNDLIKNYNKEYNKIKNKLEKLNKKFEEKKQNITDCPIYERAVSVPVMPENPYEIAVSVPESPNMYEVVKPRLPSSRSKQLKFPPRGAAPIPFSTSSSKSLNSMDSSFEV